MEKGIYKGIGSNLTPVGSIKLFSSDTTPVGWLICDGTAVSETTYSALFAVIGHAYGDPGGGNFNLPDLRNKFPKGKAAVGDSLGQTGGSNNIVDHTHSHSLSTSISHTHAASSVTGSVSGSIGSGSAHTHGLNRNNGSGTSGPAVATGGAGSSVAGSYVNTGNVGATQPQVLSDSESSHTHSFSGTFSSGSAAGQTHSGSASASGTVGSGSAPGSTDSRPAYQIFNYIIKY